MKNKEEKKDTLHLISHTHWDREWYLNSEYTNKWLVPFFRNLLELMEGDREYKFVLDGQTILIEDYYDELRKLGISTTGEERRIAALVSEGRLLIGPLYLQCDWHLVSEESIVRNILVGSSMAREYGGRLDSAWLLDNFGQISQLPQIFKLSNIDSAFIWRGIEMDPQDVDSEFIWAGSDKSEINTVFLMNSFRNAMCLSQYREVMEERLEELHTNLKEYAKGGDILLLNGYEQELFPDDILPHIRDNKADTLKYRVVQSTPKDFIDRVFKDEEAKGFKTLRGELNSGRFVCVFPGVLTSRAYLKMQNYRSEKKLEKKVEPIAVMEWLSGGSYPKNLIDQTWKHLMKNHPHDSICGVSVDDVHGDMEKRTHLVDDLISSQLKDSLGSLAGRIDTSQLEDEGGYIIFNPSSHPRDFMVSDSEDGFVRDVPALGYRVFSGTEDAEIPIKVDGEYIENCKIRLKINPDGTYDIYHKDTGSEYSGLGALESHGDCGDLYSFSAPLRDRVYSSKDSQMDISYEHISLNEVRVRIKAEMDLPESLDETREERGEKTRKLPVVTTLTVRAGSPVVRVKTDLKNTVMDHAMRVVFPTGLETDLSYAGSQFDVVKREHGRDAEVLEFSEKLDGILNGAREIVPKSAYPLREFVDVTDGSNGFSVFSKGLYGYNLNRDGGVVSLTLFRGVNCISNPVRTRSGNAGPEILTPHGQCVRQMQFEYAVYPHRGDYEGGDVLREAEEYSADPVLIETRKSAGELPPTMGFVEIRGSGGNINTTGIKISEDCKGIIIRCYNPTDKVVRGEVVTALKVKRMELCNLLEEVQEELESVSLEFSPREIKTIKVVPERLSGEVAREQVRIVEDLVHEDFSDYPEVAVATPEKIEEELRKSQEIEGLDDPKKRKKRIETYFSHLYVKKAYEDERKRKLGLEINNLRVLSRIQDFIKK